jgi:hypothetical protein
VDFYRQRLLNPLSHNDISTPIYKTELESCFKELDKFPILIDNTFVLVTRKETGTKKWRIEVNKDGVSDRLSFTTTEPWVYLLYGGVRYIQEVQIDICHNDSGLFPDHAKGNLKEVFASICKGVGFIDPATMPNICDSVFCDNDGSMLSVIHGRNFRKAVNNNKM